MTSYIIKSPSTNGDASYVANTSFYSWNPSARCAKRFTKNEARITRDLILSIAPAARLVIIPSTGGEPIAS